ncbi:hypothetical protein BGZ67_010105 [Mortierella alpina]|nr:hypothetical protein BGZ67_010105 [Mortierella alpina]
MSNSTNDTIQLTQEQIAGLGNQVARLHNTTTVDQDPQIQGQVAATTYYPSDREFQLYPAIRPSDPLFLFKKDPTAEDFWEQLRKITINDVMIFDSASY